MIHNLSLLMGSSERSPPPRNHFRLSVRDDHPKYIFVIHATTRSHNAHIFPQGYSTRNRCHHIIKNSTLINNFLYFYLIFDRLQLLLLTGSGSLYAIFPKPTKWFLRSRHAATTSECGAQRWHLAIVSTDEFVFGGRSTEPTTTVVAITKPGHNRTELQHQLPAADAVFTVSGMYHKH